VVLYGAINEHVPCQGVDDAEKLDILRARRDDDAGPLMRQVRSLRVVKLSQLRRVEAQRRTHEDLMRASEAVRAEPGACWGRTDWAGCRRVAPDVFEADLNRLVSEILADGALALLCDPPRTAGSERSHPVLLQYSDAIARTGRVLDVPLLDLRGAIAEAAAADPRRTGLFLPGDTWHLAADGQALMADLIAAAVLRLHGAGAATAAAAAPDALDTSR
jgi:hypothetical protein